MKRLIIASLLILGLAETAQANTVWQAIFFEPRFLAKAWWVIPVGLLIEWPVVRWITSFAWPKSFWVTICMNAFSFMIGIILQMPIDAIMLGTPDIAQFAAVPILGSTLVEAFVVRRFRRQAINVKAILFLLLANAVTGGLTVAVVLRYAA